MASLFSPILSGTNAPSWQKPFIDQQAALPAPAGGKPSPWAGNDIHWAAQQANPNPLPRGATAVQGPMMSPTPNMANGAVNATQLPGAVRYLNQQPAQTPAMGLANIQKNNALRAAQQAARQARPNWRPEEIDDGDRRSPLANSFNNFNSTRIMDQIFR
jgi:hypothetical protein